MLPASYYRVIPRSEATWESPGTILNTAQQTGGWYQEWCSAQRIKNLMIAGGNHTLIFCHGPNGPRNDSGSRYPVAPI